MKMFRIAKIAALAAMTTAAIATAQTKPSPAKTDSTVADAAQADGPNIEFESTVVNLGEIVKGEQAEFVFKFKNTGTKDLEISQAKPSCGCTVADFSRVTKPGESGKVTAKIDTSKFKGPITKSVTVTSNDPTEASVHLQAKAIVRAIIDVSPSEQVYFRIYRGDDVPSKRVLTFTSDADNPFKIEKVESTNPVVTTKLIDVSKDSKDAERGGNYQIELDVKDDAPLGPLTGAVTVKTTHPKVPTVTLNISGQVLGEVIVTPQKVYLGQVTASTAPSVKRTVRIERRKGTDFKIDKVESSNPSIKAEVSPVEDGRVYTVTIALAEGTKPGAINANVVIRTNDKEQPTIEIPVIGTVSGS